MSDVTYTDPPDVGTILADDHVPARCAKCGEITAMLVRQGDKGASVMCCGCGAWWFRMGDCRLPPQSVFA